MGAKENKEFLIGVDGGGTNTIAALANKRGKILAIARSGSTSPRNVGIQTTVDNLAKPIGRLLRKAGKKAKILSVFIGLPSVEEEFKSKKPEIKRALLKREKMHPLCQSKITIASDQIVAFRSGTNKKNGVLLIAGTGCVAHGWYDNKESHSSGWGWLTDEGSAFWAGQRVLQAIFKDLDGRGQETKMTRLAFHRLKVKTKEDFLQKTYSQNPTKIVPLLSLVADKAAEKGDSIAQKIMEEAGEELALAANTVIKNLGFQRKLFPIVFVGGMFKSKMLLLKTKKQIKKFAPKARIILPKENPVLGAIRLARESI